MQAAPSHRRLSSAGSFLLLAVALQLLLSVSPVDAQSGTTSLRGVVTDASQAVIANVKITLTNPATGLMQSTTTTRQGEYQFLQLSPGSYTVTASADGFSPATREGVTLLVDTPATLNLSLSVGRVEAQVEVVGNTGINSTDATLGNPFDSKQILELPSEGRNPVELLSLQAGVAYLGTNTDPNSDSRSGAVNGTRSDQTDITVDGLDNNDQLLGIAFTGVLRMPMDSLEEFRVTTSNANADAGRSSGAEVSMVTKSGTNQFHGSLYEYNRTRFGVANDWFNKEAQLESGLPNEPGQLIRNTYGVSLGGPLRRDRLFFFGIYEGQRSREAVQQNQSVPMPSLRNGIVTYLGQDGNNHSLTPAQLRSIDTGCLGSGSCPLGNGPNPAVLQLWNGGAKLPGGEAIPAYPSPNTLNSSGSDGGLNIGGYTFAAPQPQDLNTFVLKLDWNIKRDGSQRVFVRGNLQDDQTLDAAQFPGQPPSETIEGNNKGIAAGYTAILSPRLIDNLRFAYIREGNNQAGPNPYSNVGFWNLSDPISWARSVLVNLPVTQIVDDMTWTRGAHTLEFGGNWRMIHDNRYSNEQNFFYGSTHPTWLYDGGIANTGQNLDPATNPAFTPVDSGFGYAYDAAVSDLTGILGSMSAVYNQNKSGQFAATGALIPRHFLTNETETYAQDSWKALPSLQLTFGLRYTLLQPPYETSGNQVAPTPSLASFFAGRTKAMEQGKVYGPPISFALAGQANGKQPYWGWDPTNFSPRFAFAYSPTPTHGFWQTLLGSGKTAIHGGYGLYFDHFGIGVVNSFDRLGSFGLTTNLENPSGVETTNCVVRFTSLTVLPGTNGCPEQPNGPRVPELPSQPAGGFPSTPPGAGQNGSFAIAWGLDNTMKTPYAHVVDFSIQRELPARFTVQLAYVGHFGRRLLQEVDMAEPVNMTDPRSGTTYFQAATQLAKLANAKTPIANVAPIPFWQDLFPGAAGTGLFSCTNSAGNNAPCAPGPAPAAPSATQNIYDLYYANSPNYLYALQSLDTYCFPACSVLAPNGYAFWDAQFSSLYAWRSTGTSNYNGFEFTLRRHVGGVAFDLNYTYSKSMDENSNAERINEYENGAGTAVAYSGQVINSWDTKGLYGPSDFDTRNQINGNWLLDLPVGRGKKFASNLPAVANAALGGWQLSGLARWTTGYPFSISTYAFATDYEQDSRAIVVGSKPRTGVSVQDGIPNIFKAGPVAASNAFRFAYPGESGERNNLAGPGYFGVDMSLAKEWALRHENSVRFAWDVFNSTNSVRFDDGTINQYLLYQQSLGNFSQTLTKPRVMQFSLRYSY
jgi:hypothetical protein